MLRLRCGGASDIGLSAFWKRIQLVAPAPTPAVQQVSLQPSSSWQGVRLTPPVAGARHPAHLCMAVPPAGQVSSPPASCSLLAAGQPTGLTARSQSRPHSWTVRRRHPCQLAVGLRDVGRFWHRIRRPGRAVEMCA
jgi:hypothetical protein